MNILHLIRRRGFLSDGKRLELYPPLWLMRVKVLEISNHWRTVRIKLPLNILTRNRSGTMFGGSQAALADPIAALACTRVFPGYSVWTRALQLDFVHEGTADLELRFAFDPALETQIRSELEHKGRSTPSFEYGFYLGDGTLCTRIRNTVAIRPRGYKKAKDATDLGGREDM